MDFEFQSTGAIEGLVRAVVQREIETTAGPFSAASLVIFDPATLNLPGSVLDGRSGALVGRDIALRVPGIEGGIQTTRFTLHGTGGLAGMKLLGRAVGLEFTGTLLVPPSALGRSAPRKPNRAGARRGWTRAWRRRQRALRGRGGQGAPG